MRQMDSELIQPGWEVWMSGGELLGRVIQTNGPTLTLKKEGIFGGEMFIPRDAIREVEEGRVEIALSKQEATTAAR